MQKTKKFVKTLFILLAVLAVVFAATRYSRLTTYIPFTGRIFHVSPEEVRSIRVASSDSCTEVNFETEEELEEICNVLNNLRYQWWIPKIPLEMGGWSRAVFIYTEDRHYFFQYGDSFLLCRGIWYWISPESFAPLLEYVE